MAPFLQVVGVSRSQNVRIGKQVLTQWYGGDIPGVNLQTGTFAVPIYVDLGDGPTKRDLQHHSTLGSYVDIALSPTTTSDLFWSGTAPTVGVVGQVVTIGTGGNLKSRTFSVDTTNSALSTVKANLSAGATITLPSNSGGAGTRVDAIVSNALGVFSLILGTPGGAAAVVPAGYILVTAPSTTTGNVTTATFGGPTS